MARTVFNHRGLVKGSQAVANEKAIYPGMIVTFKYVKEGTSDKLPMILVLWNDVYRDLFHGLNLNYLSSNKMDILFEQLTKGVPSAGGANPFRIENQSKDTYDDKLPYRNMLKKPYTRMKLPTYREIRKNNPLSKSEAEKQMNFLYEKILKRFLNRGKDYQVYRSYDLKKVKTLRVLELDLTKIMH